MSLTEQERSHVAELLPWFLNGSLDDDERQLVEEALKVDAALRRELGEVAAAAEALSGHPDTATLVAFAAGELGSAETEAVENHLRNDPLAAELVEAARASLSLEGVDAEGAKTGPRETRDRPEAPAGRLDSGVVPFPSRPAESSATSNRLWRGLALAATVLAMLSLWGWLSSGPGARVEGPVVAVQLVELLPDDMVLRGGSDADDLLPGPQGEDSADRVVVILVTELARDYETYEVTVEPSSGPARTVAVELAPDGTVSVLLAPDILSGPGTMTLTGRQSGSPPEQLHRYSWSGRQQSPSEN